MSPDVPRGLLIALLFAMAPVAAYAEEPSDAAAAVERVTDAAGVAQATPLPPTTPPTTLPTTLPPTLPAADASAHTDERTNVGGAAFDSLKLLLMEHAIRLGFQEKTRQALRGPFWSDYRHSVRIPRKWEDTDAWWVNYIGHPIHGAAAGYLLMDHDPHAPVDIALSRPYWMSRVRAFGWAAGYSLQFEVGPLSEASIGNVGLRPETTGWVDHVVTPVGAFGLIVAEDVLDRYFVQWIERHTKNRVVRATVRLAFSPARILSNSASGRLPWYRAGRPLTAR